MTAPRFVRPCNETTAQFPHNHATSLTNAHSCGAVCSLEHTLIGEGVSGGHDAKHDHTLEEPGENVRHPPPIMGTPRAQQVSKNTITLTPHEWPTCFTHCKGLAVSPIFWRRTAENIPSAPTNTLASALRPPANMRRRWCGGEPSSVEASRQDDTCSKEDNS